MNGYGIALGGGGARGGYEIGVWKALKELEIPIEAISGTSVGALNGAIIIQDDFNTAYDLWTSVTIEKIINIESAISSIGENRKTPLETFRLIRESIKSRGLDVTPLKQLLHQVVDEKKIKESPIDFGIVTFSVSKLRPEKLFKNDISEGRLVDYLLASSCFPIFKPYVIGDARYIDGGVYDNIPASMLIEKGIDNIIMVDISGPGRVRSIDKNKVNVVHIKNSEDLGGILEFDGERSRVNIEVGYYDTLKAFGRLQGSKYYFVPHESSRISCTKHTHTMNREDLKTFYHFYGLEPEKNLTPQSRFISYRIIKTIKSYVNGELNEKTAIPAMAEICAEQLGLDRRRIYTLDQLIDRIMEEYECVKCETAFVRYINTVDRLALNLKSTENSIDIGKISIDRRFQVFYNPYLNSGGKRLKQLRRLVAAAFPKIAVSNMFIGLMLSKSSAGAGQTPAPASVTN